MQHVLLPEAHKSHNISVMERNADECLNITLNHTLKSSILSSVLPTLPGQPSTPGLSFAGNNAFHGGKNIMPRCSDITPQEKNEDFPGPW